MLERNKAFTLIELLVVISIISLLASIVLAAVNDARTRAQIATARQQMRSFDQAVGIAQSESLKILMTMSSNGGSTVPNCSLCASCTGDLRGATGVCYTNWVAVLNGVQSNTNGIVTNLTSMTRDPWGSPYLVDENQGEVNCVTYDTLRSAGPDGISGTSDDVQNPIQIPLSGKCP